MIPATFPAPALPARKDVSLLLALCPAIAVSDTLVTALGLGLAILPIILVTSIVVFWIHRWLPTEARIPIVLLITAAATASTEMLMNAWMHDLRESLAVFLTVTAVNIAILHQALDSAALRTTVLGSLKSGAIITGILALLGAGREMVGRGSLLHDAANLFGPAAAGAEINLFSVDMGFLLAMLPPGAFISLGVLLAALNWASRRRKGADATR